MSSTFTDYYRIQEERDPFSQNELLDGGALLADGDDVLDIVRRELGVSLPFDLNVVVDDLRLERYALRSIDSQSSVLASAVKNMYYLLRPLLPVSVRKHMQRLSLRGYEKIPFPSWPVDTTVDQLMARAMTRALESSQMESMPFIWFWPEGHGSCLTITHDVETAAGRDFCETLMDVDESHGFKSAFQIVPEKRYKAPGSFLERIRERGFEINIHGLNHDGHLFSSEKLFRERAERINAYGREYGAKGFRSPVLYRNQDWFDALDFAYDMSVPNVAHLDPQHGGCCTVMPYFIGDILELPLTMTQDYSLFHVIRSLSIDLWREQIEIVIQSNGLPSFNIHPDYIREEPFARVYQDLLKYLEDIVPSRNIWMALPGEVNEWWRQRSRLRVERLDGKWVITGEGCERAVVAVARIRGGQVEYDLEGGQ